MSDLLAQHSCLFFCFRIKLTQIEPATTTCLHRRKVTKQPPQSIVKVTKTDTVTARTSMYKTSFEHPADLPRLFLCPVDIYGSMDSERRNFCCFACCFRFCCLTGCSFIAPHLHVYSQKFPIDSFWYVVSSFHCCACWLLFPFVRI